jgi:urea transport system substrate-binding protein
MSADETGAVPAGNPKPATSQAGSSKAKRNLPRAKMTDERASQAVGDSASRQAGPGEPLPKIGNYVVNRLLDVGGMGHVYLAHDPHLDRDVAIKVLPREFTADEQRVKRFLREARLAAKIQHPNTVIIHQVTVEDGLASIVMELLDGGSLEEIVAERGPLPWREATQAIRDAAAGLAAAHEIGLVHRDVKPANLMRTGKGVTKVVDFGLVRATPTPAATFTRSSAPIIIS